jgi:hypothetical protein
MKYLFLFIVAVMLMQINNSANAQSLQKELANTIWIKKGKKVMVINDTSDTYFKTVIIGLQFLNDSNIVLIKSKKIANTNYQELYTYHIIEKTRNYMLIRVYKGEGNMYYCRCLIRLSKCSKRKIVFSIDEDEEDNGSCYTGKSLHFSFPKMLIKKEKIEYEIIH